MPSNLLNLQSALLVGNTVGNLHEDYVKQRAIVTRRYICIRVDIKVEKSLAVDYFHGTDEG